MISVDCHTWWWFNYEVVSDSCDPMTARLLCPWYSPARQEYWSGLPFPPSGDLPNPGIEPGLLHCRQILYRLSYEATDLGTTTWGVANSQKCLPSRTIRSVGKTDNKQTHMCMIQASQAAGLARVFTTESPGSEECQHIAGPQ